MRRIREILPSPRAPPIGGSIRPRDQNPIFILADNLPIPVTRIQVRSISDDVQPEREPQPPPSQSDQERRNELPLVDGLQQLHDGDDEKGDGRPQEVQVELPDEGNDMSNVHPQAEDAQEAQGLDEDVNLQQVGRFRLKRNRTEARNGPRRTGQRSPLNRNQNAQSQVELQDVPTFLSTHFEIMYYLGLSPIKGNGERGSSFQMVAFAIVTTLALMSTFAWCKLFIADGARAGNLQDYITAWYYISRILLQLGFVWLVVFSYNSISAVLQGAVASQAGIQYKTNQANVSKLSVMFSGFAISAAISEAIRLDALYTGDLVGPGMVILSQSHRSSLLLFLWTKESNGTDNYDILYEKYGQQLTPTTMSLGIFGIIFTFFGTLQETIIKDILLMAAMNTFRIGQIFQSNVIKVCNGNPASDQLTSRLRKMHANLSEIADEMDSSLASYFKLVHADYLLYCAYFLTYLLKPDVNAVYVVQGILILLKIACILYFSSAAIQKSHDARSVIRKKFCADECPDDVNLKKVMLLLQTLEECPIAIGRGNFIVDETFALKFIGAVVTFFLFFMESEKEKEKLRRRR